ncbi:MAG: cohesin domain-containing protein, partial [Dehalococcoidia bacterium]|nr:cohesin domain-containing protein [Dehalococcoidia bacterium]
VSGNGSMSSFDSALIAQFAVGLITQFPVAAALGSDWFMVPGSIAYTPLLGDSLDQDFLAGLFGDISGNYPSAPVSSPATTDAAIPLTAVPSAEGAQPDRTGKPAAGARLKVSSLTAAPGQTISVAISAEGAEQAIAFDLALRFDPAVLRPVGVEVGTRAATFVLTPNLAEPGVARIALFDSRPLAAAGDIAVISFEVVGRPGDESALSLSASLNEGQIPAATREGTVRVRPRR